MPEAIDFLCFAALAVVVLLATAACYGFGREVTRSWRLPEFGRRPRGGS